MGNRKPTDRQIVKQWIVKDNIPSDEHTLSKVFRHVMDNMRKYPGYSLQQAYVRTYIEYAWEMSRNDK